MTVRSSKLMTAEETAEMMNVSVRFVRRLIAERRIAVHRLGRHVRIAESDVEAFIAQGRNEAMGFASTAELAAARVRRSAGEGRSA